jgi:hypothetical protein
MPNAVLPSASSGSFTIAAVRRLPVTLLLALVVALAATLLAASPALAVTKLTHAQAASRLSAAGIGWTSSGGCSDRNNSTCTSFEQINQETVDGVITFHSASGCAVTITGGTEVGHAAGTYSHFNGYKVDVSPTTCVSNHITTHYPRIGDRSDGAAQYQSASGNIYARESNHWDITYFSCGC